MPIRRQAIIWTNYALIYWRIYASHHFDELTVPETRQKCRCHFWNYFSISDHSNFIVILLKCHRNDPVNNKSVPIKVITWCRMGDKPSPDTRVTQYYLRKPQWVHVLVISCITLRWVYPLLMWSRQYWYKNYDRWARIWNIYRQTSNISRTLLSDNIVDHSDVVGASPVGAAPTTSSFLALHLASMDWAKSTGNRGENHLSFGIWCDLY